MFEVGKGKESRRVSAASFKDRLAQKAVKMRGRNCTAGLTAMGNLSPCHPSSGTMGSLSGHTQRLLCAALFLGSNHLCSDARLSNRDCPRWKESILTALRVPDVVGNTATQQ